MAGGVFRQTLHASFPHGVKMEAEGQNSGDKAARPPPPEASRLSPSLSLSQISTLIKTHFSGAFAS